jgi:hypothetical protein
LSEALFLLNIKEDETTWLKIDKQVNSLIASISAVNDETLSFSILETMKKLASPLSQLVLYRSFMHPNYVLTLWLLSFYLSVPSYLEL